jgi:5-methylcytosine-specific restriction enzyme subunit McrC
MAIPILNIYYLLSYAWNKLEEAEKIRSGVSDYKQTEDLLARLLLNGCNLLLRRGLDRDYIRRSEIYKGVKGKINFTESINGDYFRRSMAVCEIDEFSGDILVNQILKSTFLKLIKVQTLHPTLRNEARQLIPRFSDVQDVELTDGLFGMVRIHRNNFFYDLVLSICKIINTSISVTEDKGEVLFRDFSRDSKAMAVLFENFVFQFYRREFPSADVYRPRIRWNATSLYGSDLSLLPVMQTDICFETGERKIIIDAKYYSDTTVTRHESEKFRSTNLYQIFSYVKNLEASELTPLNKNAEGILLYPQTGNEFNHSYMISGHKISIWTVDLSKEWREIDSRLRQVVSSLEHAISMR